MMRLLWISILVVCGLPLALAGQENPDTSHCPCCSPAHRQFDFWIGDWVAYDLQKEEEKVVAGTNRIVLLQDSCILQENWVSQNGKFTGTSYNWYDRQTAKWHQSWIDNQGGSLQLSGSLRDGKMVLLSEEMKSQNGEPFINRVTWSPKDDGSVRQLWEISKDDGQTWQTVFDGLYVKKDKGKN
jgi:hypothetical protein